MVPGALRATSCWRTAPWRLRACCAIWHSSRCLKGAYAETVLSLAALLFSCGASGAPCKGDVLVLVARAVRL
jgi:hypothetical protein